MRWSLLEDAKGDTTASDPKQATLSRTSINDTKKGTQHALGMTDVFFDEFRSDALVLLRAKRNVGQRANGEVQEKRYGHGRSDD